MTNDIVADARYEYSQTGTLKTSTFMKLTNAGFDAEILMAQFAVSHDNEYPDGYGTGEQ